MTRVALFGGSFNPPHEGHVLAAAHVLSTAVVDSVLVVPVYEHALSKQLSSFEHRMKMAQLAFEWIPGVVVSDIESRLAAPSRTLRTVEELQRRHPDWRLRLMVGSDILRELHQWHAFEEIERRAPPLVLTRAGDTAGRSEASVLPMVSSSEIRALLRAPAQTAPQQARLRQLVPHPVLSYLATHALYPAEPGPRGLSGQ